MSAGVAGDLRPRIEAFLAGHPDIEPEWHVRPHGYDVVFPASPPRNGATELAGFEVRLEAGTEEVTIFTDGFHTHCDDLTDEPPVDRAMWMLEGMLLGSLRLREVRRAGFAYRWHLEAEAAGAWETIEMVVLPLWPYFFPKRETIYRNKVAA